MQNVLILDTETTNKEVKHGSIIELGVVLYSLVYQTILAQVSYLYYVVDNPAEKINKIPAKAAQLWHTMDIKLVELVKSMVTKSDAIIAHNKDFDIQWMTQAELPDIKSQRPWICTYKDVKWPDIPAGGLALPLLALHYGMAVFDPHRALYDCGLIAGIFSREPRIIELLQNALLPRKIYYAPCEFNDVGLREQIKEYGFKWNQLVPKKWATKLTAEEVSNLPFKVVEAPEHLIYDVR
jgi:DNA polymerase-3 subunit epsilon